MSIFHANHWYRGKKQNMRLFLSANKPLVFFTLPTGRGKRRRQTVTHRSLQPSGSGLRWSWRWGAAFHGADRPDMCQSAARTWTASSEELPLLPAGPPSGERTTHAASGIEPCILLLSLTRNKILCFTIGAETGVIDTVLLLQNSVNLSSTLQYVVSF